LENAKDSGLMGTPSYMAPELLDGASASESSDLFALAVLLYEMITGDLPFTGSNAHSVLYKIINSEPEAIEDVQPDSLRELLTKALAKRPADRFSSVAEFEIELLAVANEINAKEYDFQELDTEQLKQLEIFEHSNLEMLHELANCLEITSVDSGEIIFSECQLDEYVCLIEGKALLIADDKRLEVKAKQWLSESVLSREFSRCRCEASSKSQVLRVSKSKLLESSTKTQAYFFRFILERIFV